MAQQPQWMVAQDTFAGDLESGAGFTVIKGQHLLSTDEIVKLDAGRGKLFLPAETGEDDKAAEKPTGRRATGKAGS